MKEISYACLMLRLLRLEGMLIFSQQIMIIYHPDNEQPRWKELLVAQSLSQQPTKCE